MKCVFLDRDGVLNYDSPNYVYESSEYRVYEETNEALNRLKEAGFLLIVMTNQAGLSKGIYTREQMEACHKKLQEEVKGIIDDIYYSPYHPTITRSLSRKPGTLLFERAISKWSIDVSKSWMVGDKPSDIEPAKALGLQTIAVNGNHPISGANFVVDSIGEVPDLVLV